MKSIVLLAIMTMGFSGLVAEILLLREFLIVFSGNELCIGVILANWLILEAFGVFFLGAKTAESPRRTETFAIVTTIFSASLIWAIFIIRILKGLIGLSVGEPVSFLPMFYSSFLLLLPVSIPHGAQFTLTCSMYSVFFGESASCAGKVYAYEMLGTIVGGVVCTYLLIPHFDTLQVSLALAVFNLVVCLCLLARRWQKGRYQRILLSALGLMGLCFLFLLTQEHRLHRYSIRKQWKGHNIVHYENSRYGNICVIENEGQYIFFQDGIASLITPIPDIAFVEEFVHFPLLTHPEPKEVLVLGGGAGGVINEVLKHPSIQILDYAELDPLLIELLRKFPTPLTRSELNDERVRISYSDGRLFLRTTPRLYDVIFVGVMELSSLQSNRFFTSEFFRLARKKLRPAGILVIGVPGSLTYLSEELKNLNSCILNTLRSSFRHVRVIPGDAQNLFLASDSQGVTSLGKTRIVERLQERKIEPGAMVPWYIEQKLHPGWQEWFHDFLEGSADRINYDFAPIGLFYAITHWNTLFAPYLRGIFAKLERVNLGCIALLVLVFLGCYLLLRARRKKLSGLGVPLCILTTGFAGMIFDLMLILSFQVVYGYVFSWVGLLVAGFMAGATCGSMLMAVTVARVENCRRFLIAVEVGIICFSCGCCLMFLSWNGYRGGSGILAAPKLLFLVLCFLSGFLVGSQFPLANRMYLRGKASITRTAGLLYAYDLLAGWVGGIAGAVVLLPVLGLAHTCLAIVVLKLTSLVVVLTEPV